MLASEQSHGLPDHAYYHAYLLQKGPIPFRWYSQLPLHPQTDPGPLLSKSPIPSYACHSPSSRNELPTSGHTDRLRIPFLFHSIAFRNAEHPGPFIVMPRTTRKKLKTSRKPSHTQDKRASRDTPPCSIRSLH